MIQNADNMPETKYTIIAIGELLWDILPDTTVLGGAPSNVAFRLNELGDDSILVSRVGNDELGKKALITLKNLGVSTSFIQEDRHFPTGTVQVIFDRFNLPEYIIEPDVAFDHIELTPDLMKTAENADYVVFGTLAQRSHRSNQTITEILFKSKRSVRFLDVNLRKDCYTKESIEQSLHFADILKMNRFEALEMKRIFHLSSLNLIKIMREISRHFEIRTILVTLDEYGVLLFNEREGQHYIPGYRIKMSDSLGSGDAFSAAFIHNRLHNKSLIDACITGNQLGAAVTATKGATAPVGKDKMDLIVKKANLNFDQTYRNYKNLVIHESYNESIE